MTTLKFSSTAPDPTQATMVSTIWTIVEANTGIICSCSPMLKTPLTRLFPHLFSRTGTRTTTDPLTGRPPVPPALADDGTLLRVMPPGGANGGSAAGGRSMNLDGAGWEGGEVAHVASVVVGGGRPGGGGVGGGSRDRLVGGGVEGGVVPYGAISKTTDVDVRVHY